MLPSIRYIAAGLALVAIIFGVGAIYAKGRADAAAARLKSDLMTATRLLETERRARLSDNIAATENARRNAGLAAKIEELEDHAQSLDGACLDGPTSDRLRNLWQ